MDAIFYQWFLRELLEALRGMELGEATSDATVVTPGPARQTLTTPEGLATPRGQSLLTPRPRQGAVIARVGGSARLLGDGTRYQPPMLPVTPQGALLVVPRVAWLAPWPVMPPQAAPTSVWWDGPPHAAHAWSPQPDGLFDNHYPRASSVGLCPPLESGWTMVEVSGVFPAPGLRRCQADTKARPEHLATNPARYNLRLPVMAGVDATGAYLRVIRMPMKTHEYRPLQDDDGGGGGDPT